MRRGRFLALLAVPLAAACSSSYMQPAEPTGPPGPEEAKVVVYRTSSLFGGAVTFPVYDGEKLIGFTEKGAYCEYRCPPGKRLFLSWAENEKVVEATLAGGKTYYLESYAKVGAFTSACGLDPIGRDHKNWSAVQDLVAGLECRAVIPERAAEHEEKRRDKARKIMKEHAAGEEDSKFLKAEDGK